MQVVGVTTQQEVYVVSRERKFRVNEILVLEDATLQSPKGEVIETLSYNRFIPMGLEKSLVDTQVIRTLEQIGYDIDSDEINLAKLRLFEEAPHPVRTGCTVRIPDFSEIGHLLVQTTPEEGMLLGEILGTERLAQTMTEELSDQIAVMEQGKLRQQQGVPFVFDIHSMQQYPHVGIFGGSGSGKSFALRVMLEELMKLRIPTVVFDPHYEMLFHDKMPGVNAKAEFADRFTAVQIGKQVGISFSDLTTRDVMELLGAAGGHVSESMVNVIQMLHRRKDSFASFSDRINNLVLALEEGKANLERQLREDLNPSDMLRVKDLLRLLQQYGTLPASSVKGVHWRLNRLDKAGLFQHDIRAIENGIQQGKLLVVQGSSWLLQVFATYVIGALYRKRRDYRDARMHGQEAEFFPPFVIATDEAHQFAPKATDSPTKSILKEIAQEGRKYGVFLFLATQRPTLLDETITAQLNSKFIFRTVRGSDIGTLKEETDLTHEEGKRLPYLRSGDCFVSSATFGRTLFIRIRCAYTTSPHLANPFDELKAISHERDEKVLQSISEMLPLYDTDLVKATIQVNREGRLDWDVSRLKQELERLTSDGLLSRHPTPFATRYDAPVGK